MALARWGERRGAEGAKMMDGRNDRATLLAAGVGAGAVGWKILQRMREADFRGKTAVVTGGSRGLGFLIARELARGGCRVVICARDDAELRRAADELHQQGAEVIAVGCDVSDQAQVENMVEITRRHYGGVDVLMNVAGILDVGPIESMT